MWDANLHQHTKVLIPYPLYPRHLEEELKQRPVQPLVLLLGRLYQLQQPWESPLLVHDLEGFFILLALEQEEGGHEVEDVGRVFLFRVSSLGSAKDAS